MRVGKRWILGTKFPIYQMFCINWTNLLNISYSRPLTVTNIPPFALFPHFVRILWQKKLKFKRRSDEWVIIFPPPTEVSTALVKLILYLPLFARSAFSDAFRTEIICHKTGNGLKLASCLTCFGLANVFSRFFLREVWRLSNLDGRAKQSLF